MCFCVMHHDLKYFDNVYWIRLKIYVFIFNFYFLSNNYSNISHITASMR